MTFLTFPQAGAWFLLLALSLVSTNSHTADVIAGGMTETDICSTSGYLLRQALGKAFNTVKVPCSAKNIGGNKVEISAGYVSPLGPTMHYKAHGTVNGNKLRLDDIQIIGVDDEPIPFSRFPI